MYKPLEKYAVIGNCRSLALVGEDGSIDFCCLPDFDSGAYFCALLDQKKGGFWKIAPSHGHYQSYQRYKKSVISKETGVLHETNILKTVFFNQHGNVVVTDLMPISRQEDEKNTIPKYGLKIIRKIKAVRGWHMMKMSIKVTPDFARKKPTITQELPCVQFQHGDQILSLNLPKGAELTLVGDILEVELRVNEGEEVFFALSLFEKRAQCSSFTHKELHAIAAETEKYWEWWISKCTYKGSYRPMVERSALTLKLLTYRPTGAIIAAGTTSLPEKIGGWFNWDYRYSWLRDSAFTTYAFISLGYLDETRRFMKWLETVCTRTDSMPQIMYGIRGEQNLPEQELSHLEGYRKSSPVRIGNEAVDQKQFDIFGEVLSSIRLYVEEGGVLDDSMQAFVVKFVNYCCKHWSEKDAGIWEGRGGYKHHTYSKLMCWVGIDHGIHLAKHYKLNADVLHWAKEKEAIRKDILENGYNKEIGAFVDTYGSSVIDASSLVIPSVGFLPADDPRVLSTLNHVMEKLLVDWFVLRTSNEQDEIKKGEGAFFLSSFWLIDIFSALGRCDEAGIWLKRIVDSATPVGLYAEEMDPYSKTQLGNFPQAFTHLALINSVLAYEQSKKYGDKSKKASLLDRLNRATKMYKLKKISRELNPVARFFEH